MSEQAYAMDRIRDEQAGGFEDDGIFDFECPKCGSASNSDERGRDGLCVNCTLDNAPTLEQIERLASRQLIERTI